MWILTVRSVGSVPREHPLKPGQTIIGRKAESDICIADDSASRRHAAVDFDPETNVVTLTDLGSLNGTFAQTATKRTSGSCRKQPRS